VTELQCSVVFVRKETRPMHSIARLCSLKIVIVLSMVLACGLSLADDKHTRKPGYRKLAPGVMKDVDSTVQVKEASSRHDLVELITIDPSFDWAKDLAFRRDVWALEFKFKPVRMIEVDIPQPSGRMRRKLIWYLVYSVENTGNMIRAVPDESDKKHGTYKVQEVAYPVRFVPEFLLESHEFGKAYPDRVIPAAMKVISLREDPNRKFLNSVDMSREIGVGEKVWGVATWEDVDPRIDRFSIYVQGLTNAYKWADKIGEYKQGDPLLTGRSLYRKTLKLNFWRPGDEYSEDETEIRYGLPGQVDYEWVYR